MALPFIRAGTIIPTTITLLRFRHFNVLFYVMVMSHSFRSGPNDTFILYQNEGLLLSN